MKKVLFICLLTLSVCLSKPSDPPAPPPAAAPAQKPTEAPASPSHPADTKEVTTPAPIKTPAVTDTKAAGTITETPKPDAHPKPSNDSSNNTDKGKAAPNKDNAVPTTLKPATEPASKNATVAPSGDAASSTTTHKPDGPTNATVAPTPKNDDKDKAQPAPVLARGFDGSSFFGGIILTLGLLAIGFMGYKYYKNQTERNYHTL